MVFDNKLWVIAGFSEADGHMNDIWSSPDGVNWKEENPEAEFPTRFGHTTAVFDNKLWVIAGYNFLTGGRKNDIWFSSDGIEWTQANPAAPFSKRTGHSSVVFDDKLWVIGGDASDGGTTDYVNDVWSSLDGSVWEKVQQTASFSPRARYSTVVFDEKIWLIGGVSTEFLEDKLYYTVDGKNWLEVNSQNTFSPRSGHSSTVFNEQIWIIGGHDGEFKNDVWVLE